MKTISSYSNGNCRVDLYEDGTKVREWYGTPRPEYPESVDLKITDYCDAGCPYCHERSTKRGRHALTEELLGVLSQMQPGSEVAIGGGNPLSHPDLIDILSYIDSLDMFANLTVNERHVMEDSVRINDLRGRGLVRGLGISLNRVSPADINEVLDLDGNEVYHCIVGVNNPTRVISYGGHMQKMLVLGYKQFGFGERFFDDDVSKRIESWSYWLPSVVRAVGHVSFDNLALSQLKVKDRVRREVWDGSYMGDDGEFTMYIDAVRMEFATSSTSPREPIAGRTVKNMFRAVREKRCCI